jgi:3-methylfumaryl-CoA hydratase
MNTCLDSSLDSNLDADFLRTWIGRTQTDSDIITAAPLRMMRATLDIDATVNSDSLPPLWHWLYFLPSPNQSDLGADGHARRGGFLPPVPLPRRMWAAGQFEFFHDLELGDTISRTSTIDNVTVKQGRTGSLCFVKVRHEISNAAGLAIREFHDIVYRPLAQGDLKEPSYEAAPTGAYSEVVTPTDPLLFRYSALTFNGHRIHYDRRYVTEVEGYPGLIVHGPLMATLLARLGTQLNPQDKPITFEFRALKPVFDLHPFEICADEIQDGAIDLWVKDHAGHVTMKAVMRFKAARAAGVNP